MADDELRSGEIVHACPFDGQSFTPCCGRHIGDLPRTDRVTLDPALITCPQPAPVAMGETK